jgi:hypothetical protein
VTRDQFLNILAFLTLMNNEFAPQFFVDKAPEYIIEKWTRYIGGPPPVGPCWEWGLHSTLRDRVFDPYVERYAAEMDELFGAQVEV